MSQEQSPRLSHVGLYVNDVPRMIDFYTRVLGFVVSDGAPDGRITFLSRNPSDHHQVVLVRGRNGDLDTPMVQQVSFNVGTLANVQRVFRKVREANCKVIDPRCHGNAWYNTVYIPGYLAVSGCLGARRFVAVEGQPKYLTVYEFEHARVSESDAWTRARASNPWTRRVQPNLRHDEGSPGIYQRIYPK